MTTAELLDLIERARLLYQAYLDTPVLPSDAHRAAMHESSVATTAARSALMSHIHTPIELKRPAA